MVSARELPQLLEPSNLLEPLDLTEQRLDFVHPLSRPQANEKPEKGFRRTSAAALGLRPSRQRRFPLKSALMLAGALACFGAGTLLSQLHSLPRWDVEPDSTVGSASQRSSTMTQPTSAGPTSAELRSAAATPNDSPAIAPTATPTAGAASSAEGGGSAGTQTPQAAPPVQPTSAGRDALQQTCPKEDANCLEGGAPSPAKELTTTDGRAAYRAADAQPARPKPTSQSAIPNRPRQ